MTEKKTPFIIVETFKDYLKPGHKFIPSDRLPEMKLEALEYLNDVLLKGEKTQFTDEIIRQFTGIFELDD